MNLIGLIKSKTREKVLRFFFLNQEKKYYLRELERILKVPVGNIRRELISLEKLKLFKHEKIGNLVYYSLDKSSPFFGVVEDILSKTADVKKEKNIKSDKGSIQNLIKFLWEYRVLKYINIAPHKYFLKGPVKENVAEHSFYSTIIGWVLAGLEDLDENKVIKMSLIHDLVGVRGGTRDLINNLYSKPPNTNEIMREISNQYPIKNLSFDKLFQELSEGRSLESKIVKDSSVLAKMLLEKEYLDLGNKRASKWLDFSMKRLETKKAQELGKHLIKLNSDVWWLEVVKERILKIN